MPKQIIIYTVAGCPKCYTAKEYFKSKNLEFQEFDVRADHSKAKEMIEKTQQKSVPVIDIDGVIIVGFDKEKIDQALSS